MKSRSYRMQVQICSGTCGFDLLWVPTCVWGAFLTLLAMTFWKSQKCLPVVPGSALRQWDDVDNFCVPQNAIQSFWQVSVVWWRTRCASQKPRGGFLRHAKDMCKLCVPQNTSGFDWKALLVLLMAPSCSINYPYVSVSTVWEWIPCRY